MLIYQHSTLSGGVLIAKSTDPHGCIKGVLSVPSADIISSFVNVLGILFI
jgi:hypothetical protein